MLDLFLKANTLLCCKRKQGRGNFQRQHYLHLHWKPVRLAGKFTNFFLNYDFFFFATPHGLQDPSSPIRNHNSCPLQWKHGILTTGLPRNSQLIFPFFFLVYAFANILAKISPTTYSMQEVTSVFFFLILLKSG